MDTEDAVDKEPTEAEDGRPTGSGKPNAGRIAVRIKSCVRLFNNCFATPGDELISMSHT